MTGAVNGAILISAIIVNNNGIKLCIDTRTNWFGRLKSHLYNPLRTEPTPICDSKIIMVLQTSLTFEKGFDYNKITRSNT